MGCTISNPSGSHNQLQIWLDTLKLHQQNEACDAFANNGVDTLAAVQGLNRDELNEILQELNNKGDREKYKHIMHIFKMRN